MKSICKLTLAALTFTFIFTATELNAQSNEDSKIGLTVGIDYVSNYLYRGIYYYNGQEKNGGMLSPYTFYDVFNTGLSLGIKGEVTERWFWNNKDEKQNDSVLFKLFSVDFNINYMYNLKEKVTLNLGVWYYLHSKEHTNGGVSFNRSFFDFYFSAIIDSLQLKPMFAITYSYLTDKKYVKGIDSGSYVWGEGPGKNGDLYLQLGIGHSFKLMEKSYLDFNAVAGFFNKNTYDIRTQEVQKDPGTTDISDIDLSLGLTTIADILTFSTSFHYVIVPGTQYKYSWGNNSVGKEIHRFYTKFGVACSI